MVAGRGVPTREGWLISPAGISALPTPRAIGGRTAAGRLTPDADSTAVAVVRSAWTGKVRCRNWFRRQPLVGPRPSCTVLRPAGALGRVYATGSDQLRKEVVCLRCLGLGRSPTFCSWFCSHTRGRCTLRWQRPRHLRSARLIDCFMGASLEGGCRFGAAVRAKVKHSPARRGPAAPVLQPLPA
jgi:hypothetical protein